MSIQKDTLDRIEHYLNAIQRDLRLPGLSVAIVQNNRLVYAGGLGSAGAGRAVTAQTPFLLGSLSKSFTAFAILQLVEAGKLRLDDPVHVYVPWFVVGDVASSSGITLRHLLTHTSGLSCYTGRDLLSGRGEKTVEQSVRELGTKQLVHVPGLHYEYSNSNYLVLALLIEAASGESYPRYIKQHIFAPLSMHDSYVYQAEAVLAQGYRWWFGLPLPFDAPFLPDAQAAAFLISGAGDMARWLMLHLGDGILDGVRLLSTAGMQELHRPQVPTKRRGSAAAMGWRVEELAGEVILRHGGEVSNFRADMLLAPDRGLGVVTLQNCNNGLVAQLSLDQIAANVMRLLLSLPLPRKRLTLARFYLSVDLALLVLTFLQMWVWPHFALSEGPKLFAVVLLTFDSLWPLLAFWQLPRAVDMPWHGLRLYVPDLSCWLRTLGMFTILLNVMIICAWLF